MASNDSKNSKNSKHQYLYDMQDKVVEYKENAKNSKILLPDDKKIRVEVADEFLRLISIQINKTDDTTKMHSCSVSQAYTYSDSSLSSSGSSYVKSNSCDNISEDENKDLMLVQKPNVDVHILNTLNNNTNLTDDSILDLIDLNNLYIRNIDTVYEQKISLLNALKNKEFTITVPLAEKIKKEVKFSGIITPQTEKRFYGFGEKSEKYPFIRGDIVVKFDIIFPTKEAEIKIIRNPIFK